jgi:hypothetical protein
MNPKKVFKKFFSVDSSFSTTPSCLISSVVDKPFLEFKTDLELTDRVLPDIDFCSTALGLLIIPKLESEKVAVRSKRKSAIFFIINQFLSKNNIHLDISK